MHAQKPVLVFIPGAWHTPEYFTDVINKLKVHEYETHALLLPSVGGAGIITATDDAAFIRKTTTSLVNEGKDVLMVMHSYGGIPGTESTKGLLKKEREIEGKKGGIVGLVYMTAFLLPEGQSVGSFLGGYENWIIFNGNQTTLDRAPEIMYNDLPVEIGEAYAKKTLHHSAASFDTPLTYPAYKYLPTTYLLCKQDMAIPFAGQQAMASIAGEAATKHICNAAHSPMLSMPDTVVSVIREAAGESITANGQLQ
ncbi:hypothetical protein DTO207G8_3129 [Paecilomyces variotii]|nr:hypothetical protein DTO207G8_3129 [Paecilomyces variotii]